MKLPSIFLGDLKIDIPILQGGMGIGVSRSGLASAVANEGGLGVISGVQIGFLESDFEKNTKEANIRALRKEIRRARSLSPNGVLGVNLMVAMNNYIDMVKTAVEEKIDVIISGAGLPTELPEFVRNTKTKIAPIISSSKAANLITKLWDKRYKYIPDMIIVEGPEAGGHLGFSEEDILGKKLELSQILQDVIEKIKPFEEKYKRKIPVIAGGGIFDGKDISKYMSLGASGVQMATNFIATHECDAHIDYKTKFINSKEEDIVIIKSPVGLPGRAIKNVFLEKLMNGRIKVDRCYSCLKNCDPSDTIYCISDALIRAVKGDVEDGLIFTGSKSYMIDKIVSVKELMNNLVKEAELYFI